MAPSAALVVVFCIMLLCVWLSCSFSVIAFTRLEIKDGLVDVSNSYYSMSEFYQSPVTLPENPGKDRDTLSIFNLIALAFS